jgi:hypothetical protein
MFFLKPFSFPHFIAFLFLTRYYIYFTCYFFTHFYALSFIKNILLLWTFFACKIFNIMPHSLRYYIRSKVSPPQCLSLPFGTNPNKINLLRFSQHVFVELQVGVGTLHTE